MNHFRHPTCNMELKPAKGDEGAVDVLPVRRGLLGDCMATRSYWRPTRDELALLNGGGSVQLTLLGVVHPPLRVDAVANEQPQEANDG